MNLQLFDRRNLIGLSQTIGVLLISAPIAFVATQVQAQTSPLNPCPGIYYEEPFNSTRIVPQGCPPNAATQQLQGQGQVYEQPVNSSSSYQGSSQRSFESSQSQYRLETSIASVSPVNGTVDIQLRNDTNTNIAYQAVGQTQQRVLQGGESIVLSSLPVPVTVTMYRPDGGFIQVTPTSNSQAGTVAISLGETATSSQNARAIQVQQDGQIYLN